MSNVGNYQDDDQVLLHRFHAIDPHELRDIVLYYESNRERIRFLPGDQQQQIFKSYLNALYYLGDYASYEAQCDQYIAMLFEAHPSDEDWRELLSEALYKKASAAFETGNASTAAATLDSLLEIDPYRPELTKLIRRVKTGQHIELLLGISAITIVSSALAAALIAVELFYIRPFAGEWTSLVANTRIAVFAFSIVHFFVAHAVLRLWKSREARQMVSRAQQRAAEKRRYSVFQEKS